MPGSAEHKGYINPAKLSPRDLPPISSWRAPVSRAFIFLAVFAVLQLSWEALRGTAVEWAVIHHGTVQPAVFLANLLSDDLQARAVKFSLRAPGGGLNILNGCEGMEALFLLLAAFAVAPLAWRARVVGVLMGVVVVYAVNQARILALFFAYRSEPNLFNALHATVAPIVVVLLVAAYFYLWMLYANPRLATSR